MSKRSSDVTGIEESKKRSKVDTIAVRREVFDIATLPQPPLSITVADAPVDEDFIESGDEAEVLITKRMDDSGFSLDRYRCAVGMTEDVANDFDGALPIGVDDVESLSFIPQFVRNRRNPFAGKLDLDQAELEAAQPAQIAWVNVSSLPEPFRASWTVVDGMPVTVPAVSSLPASGERWRKYQRKVFTRTSADGTFTATKLVAQGDFHSVEATTRAILPGWRHSVVTFKRSKKDKSSADATATSKPPPKGTFTLTKVTHWDLKVAAPSLLKAVADFRAGIGFQDATGHLELNRRLHRARLVNAYLRASRSIMKPSRTLSMIGGDGLSSTQSAQKAIDEISLLPRSKALALQCASPEAWLALACSVGTSRVNQQEEELAEIADAVRLGRLERARRVQIRNEKANIGLDQTKVPAGTPRPGFNQGPSFGPAATLTGAQLEHMRRVLPPFDPNTEDVNAIYDIGPVFRGVVQGKQAEAEIDPETVKILALIRENALGGCSDEQLKAIADRNNISCYAAQLCGNVSLSLLPQLAKAPAGSKLAEQLGRELQEQARLIVVADWMLKTYVLLSRNRAFTKLGVFAATLQSRLQIPLSVASWMFYSFFCLDQRTGQPTHPHDYLAKYPASFDNGYSKARFLLSLFAIGLVLSPTKTVQLGPLKSDFRCAKIDDLLKQTSSWLQMLGAQRSEGPGIPFTLKAPLQVPLAEGTTKAQLERKARMAK